MPQAMTTCDGQYILKTILAAMEHVKTLGSGTLQRTEGLTLPLVLPAVRNEDMVALMVPAETFSPVQ